MMRLGSTRVRLEVYIAFIISSLCFFSSCLNQMSPVRRIKGGFSLVKKNDSLFYLSTYPKKNLDTWELPYPVYQFQVGDIDNNGLDEALVGVVKATRFDSVQDKRLFIFKNYKGLVRPLWLGSRLGKPLVDFKIRRKESEFIIRSVEREKNGKYLVAEYKWRKFGLEFISYITKETSKEEALTFLKD